MIQYCGGGGNLRDREVACLVSDRQGSHFESFVWMTASSHSSQFHFSHAKMMRNVVDYCHILLLYYVKPIVLICIHGIVDDLL